MPQLRIDNKAVTVPPGATILEAARRAGIDIPALCYLPGLRPCTSCFVCVVKVNGQERLAPSCATPAEEGMVVESQTPEVLSARRTALELLLSDHLGDCQAPCQVACPAMMDIPRMIRQLAAGDLAGAIATVKADIALPAVLGRICPAPCERACRRGQKDHPLSICLLKRYVADVDLGTRGSTGVSPVSGMGKLPMPRVAIVGAGPAGLSAAYYLLAQGHACTIFDERDQPGGALRHAITEDRLPRAVLDAEIVAATALGVTWRLSTKVGSSPSLEDLRKEFAAVVIATGQGGAASGSTGVPPVGALGLPAGEHGIHVERKTHQTPLAGVFAGGGAVRPGKMAVRAVADGKAMAVSVGQYLAGQPVTGPQRPFTVHIGRLHEAEMDLFMAQASPEDRVTPGGTGFQPVPTGGGDRPANAAGKDAQVGNLCHQELFRGGFNQQEATAEAARCLHCDCRKPDTCKLRIYADALALRPGRFKAGRRTFQQFADHPEIIYEPGKCIACGLCVQIAERGGEELGLTFVGRGFDARVAVPFGRPLALGLRKTAAQCAAACPTGAIVSKQGAATGREIG